MTELARPFAMSQPAISRHLKVLETADLIETRQSAQTRLRRLKPGALDEVAVWIERLRAQWDESFDRLDAYLRADPDQGDGVMTETFKTSRLIAHPRQRVWDAWTKPEQFAQWFGPKGSTAEVKQFDLKPGGHIHTKLTAPDGGVSWAKTTYREIDPPRRLVWEQWFSNEFGDVVPAPFPMAWPLVMLTTVVFDDEGAGTRVTLTWEPVKASEAERQSFARMIPSMTGGWTGSFDQLDAHLAGD